MESIVQAIAKHAQCNPEKICIIESKEITVSYSEFWDRIQKKSSQLKELGVKKGDVVCIESIQQAKFLEVLFACQLIGAIYIPLETGFKKEKLDEIKRENSNCLVVLSDVGEEEITKAYTYEMLETVEVYERDAFEFPMKNQICEILYTTGTTGKAKGIVLTNANNIALAENIKYGTEMKFETIELIPLPLSHSHGLRTCYAHFLNGSTVMVLDGVMNIKEILNALEKYKITALDLSPSAAKILLRLSKRKLENYQNQIEYVELGTAFLDEEIKRQLCELLPNSRLYNFYGSTEAGRACILNFNDGIARPGCIGKPSKNASFIVVDDNKKEIKSSKENLGLLAIAGSMNMVEYYMEPELTKDVLSNGYVYTHDLGYIDSEGYVYVLGRADDVINCRGIKIAPEEIETVAMKFSTDILDCACVAIDDNISGQIPKIFIELSAEIEDKVALLERLKEYFVINLEESRVPKLYEVIDKIPRTENGKVLRKVLREGGM